MRAAVLREHGATPRVRGVRGPRSRPGRGPGGRPGRGAPPPRPPQGDRHLLHGPAAAAERSWAPTAWAGSPTAAASTSTRPSRPTARWPSATLVPSDALLDVAEGVDDAVAAALGNTGLGRLAVAGVARRAAAGRDRARARRHGRGGQRRGAGRRRRSAPSASSRPTARARACRACSSGAPTRSSRSTRVDDLAAAFREAAGGDVDVTIDMLWGAPASRPCRSPPAARATCRSATWPATTITLPAPRDPVQVARRPRLLRGPPAGRAEGATPTCAWPSTRPTATSPSTWTAGRSTTSRRRGSASAGGRRREDGAGP